MKRTAEIKRTTRETDISLWLCLDGGEIAVDTGIGFLDHMTSSFALHGGLGLRLTCKGDLQVDGHHTTEDVGIALGKAFSEALGSKVGLERFGSAYVPMDEALGFAAVDISGRSFLRYEVDLPQDRVGTLDACLVKEFWEAFTRQAGITLHIKAEGGNTHHILEALFKACARALKTALQVTHDQIPSTKGAL